MTQILVTKPGTLTAGDRRKLRTASIVTVEAESPQDVRLIGAEGPPMDGNDLFFAAISAIASQRTGYASSVHEVFARVMKDILVDRRKASKAEP